MTNRVRTQNNDESQNDTTKQTEITRGSDLAVKHSSNNNSKKRGDSAA